MKIPALYLWPPLCIFIGFLFFSTAHMVLRFEVKLRGPDGSLDPQTEKRLRLLYNVFLGAAVAFGIAAVGLLLWFGLIRR